MSVNEMPVAATRSWRAPRAGRITPFRVLSVTIAVVLCVLIVYPMGAMFVRVLFADGKVNGSAFTRALSNPALPSTLLNTAIVVVASGVAALVVGSLFAWLTERTDARMGWVSRVLPLTPLLLPSIALSVGWVFLANDRAGYLNVGLRYVLGLFGVTMETGPLNITSWPGLIFVYTLFLVPFVYLVIAAALRNIDPALEEASKVSGASSWRTVWKVSLPAIRPALAGAALLVIVMGVAVFSIGRTIGVQARIPVLSVHIVNLVSTFPSQLDEAVVVGLLLLVVVGVAWSLQRRMAGAQRHATIGGRGTRASEVKLGKLRWPARVLMLGYMAATSVLPICALIFVSLTPFWTPKIDPSKWTLNNYTLLLTPGSAARHAIQSSFTLGAVGATVAMLIAAVLAVYSRQQSRSTARIVDGLTKAPGAISHIVIGVAFIVAFAGAPFKLHGTLLILLLAYIVIYMPQASIAAGSAGDQVGRELFEASAVSGASQGRTFRRIAAPLMLPGLAAGWVFLFVAIAGDLTASAMLAGTTNPVVGFVFLDIWENGTFSQLAALGTIVAVLSAVIVTAVLAIAKPRFGAAGSGG